MSWYYKVAAMLIALAMAQIIGGWLDAPALVRGVFTSLIYMLFCVYLALA